MRRFGRQCRGMGNVFVTLVRQTETRLLEMGAQVLPLARAAQDYLHGATHVSAGQRVRLHTQLTAALDAHHRIAHQSRRLTQGKALSHCKIVNAYDPTIAPICKGKSNCPAQFGRKPGIIAEPAAGFIFALHLPVGNPSDVRYVEPLVDKVEQAITRVRTRPTLAIHSLAGDLALNDATLREALHAQGILTVGRLSKQGWLLWRTTRPPWSISTSIVSRSGHACSAEDCACDAVKSINTMPH